MAPSRPPRPPARPTRDPKELLKKRGADLIRKVSDKDRYAIFLEPVDTRQVKGYTDLIERPMDLSTLQKNLQMGVYRTPMEFRADLDLIWSNCCVFNADDSIYYKEAVRLRVLCERYYDELCRLLSRDGVAAALGLSKPRRAGPYSRNASKRPLPHRMQNGNAPSSGGMTSSLQTSEPTSPEPDADVSGSASASGSASGAQPTFRDSQIRRARTAMEAAIAAAASAEEEMRNAAKSAGVTPQVSLDKHLFSGPSDIFHKSNRNIRALGPRQLKVVNHRKMDLRCAEVPEAWRRIGRWHSRGLAVSKFGTAERAMNVRFGRMYKRYIRKSAPAARRLLATVLDEHVVCEYDRAITKTEDGTDSINDRVLVGEDANHDFESQKMDCSPKAVRRDFLVTIPANGTCDSMDIDNGKIGRKHTKTTQHNAKRERSRNSPSKANRVEGAPANSSKLQVNGIPDSQPTTDRTNREMPGSIECRPHVESRSISDLQMTLEQNGIDATFLNGLVHSATSTKKQFATAQSGPERPQMKNHARDDDFEYLLFTNHATMMNVMRLRALRESANEADCEDLEDRERELLERLAQDMSFVVKKLPPNSVVNPADAAETAVAMALSTQAPSSAQK